MSSVKSNDIEMDTIKGSAKGPAMAAGGKSGTKMQMYLNNIIDSILLLLIAWVAFLIITSLRGDPAAESMKDRPLQQEVEGSAADRQGHLARFNGLRGSMIFNPEAIGAGPLASSEDIQTTGLDITLHGIQLSSNGESSVIIKVPDREEQSWRIGDQLMRGVKLVAIYKDHVRIARAGKLEQLYLDGVEQNAVNHPDERTEE